jgi:ABC-2 type transport system permease protein
MIIAVGALWWREIVKFVRERSRLVGAVAQPLGFWLLLGLGFQGSFRMPGAPEDVSYMEFLFPGILAMVVLFTAIFTTISIVEERKSGSLQAVLVSPAPRTALVLGNALGGTSIALVQTLLFLFILPALGLAPAPRGVLLVAAAAFLLGIAFTSLGFIIAWRMESTRGFHAVMNLFLLPLWFLSGAPFPADGASGVLQVVIAVNPVSYGVALLRDGLYWPGPSPAPFAGVEVSLLVMLAFAVALLAVAVHTARQPLFASR